MTDAVRIVRPRLVFMTSLAFVISDHLQVGPVAWIIRVLWTKRIRFWRLISPVCIDARLCVVLVLTHIIVWTTQGTRSPLLYRGSAIW